MPVSHLGAVDHSPGRHDDYIARRTDLEKVKRHIDIGDIALLDRDLCVPAFLVKDRDHRIGMGQGQYILEKGEHAIIRFNILRNVHRKVHANDNALARFKRGSEPNNQQAVIQLQVRCHTLAVDYEVGDVHVSAQDVWKEPELDFVKGCCFGVCVLDILAAGDRMQVVGDIELNMVNAGAFQFLQHSLLRGDQAAFEERAVFPGCFEKVGDRRRCFRRLDHGTG